PQSLPGDKMASHGDDWQTNPATQISWGLSYIKDRYGTPCAAWSHSEAVGWYSALRGGRLVTLAVIAPAPRPPKTPPQEHRLEQRPRGLRPRGRFRLPPHRSGRALKMRGEGLHDVLVEVVVEVFLVPGDIHRDVVHHLLPLGLDRDRIDPVAAFRGGPGV